MKSRRPQSCKALYKVRSEGSHANLGSNKAETMMHRMNHKPQILAKMLEMKNSLKNNLRNVTEFPREISSDLGLDAAHWNWEIERNASSEFQRC